jgi:hypothetical protein
MSSEYVRIGRKEALKQERILNLDEFFNRTNDQTTRIRSNQVSSLITNNSSLEKRFVKI